MMYSKKLKKLLACISIVTLLIGSVSALPVSAEEQTVKSESTDVLTDKEAVEADKQALNIGFTECVSRDLQLPNRGENGSRIIWESSHPQIIGNDGKFNKPKIVTKLTLTATLQKGSYKAAKKFDITANNRSFYDVVKDYLDIMLEKGRDNLGRIDSGLFLGLLERDTLTYPQYEVKTIPQVGVNMNERTDGCGLKQDIYLYELCYDLTKLTGDPKYEEAADKALHYFINYTPSEVTGFFGWGDHIVYDPITDKVTMAGHTTTDPKYASSLRMYHEVEGGLIYFMRSPFLMQKFFEIDHEATKNYLLGIWNWQIGDQSKYTVSRHSNWNGGAVIEGDYVCVARDHMFAYAWGYHYTQDPEFLSAMMACLRWFETWTSKNKYDVMPSETLYESNRFHQGWAYMQYSVGTNFTMCKNLLPEQLQERLQLYIDRADNLRMKSGYNEEKGFPNMLGVRNGIPSQWSGYSQDYYERWRQLEDGEMKDELGRWIMHWIDNNEMYDLHNLLGNDMVGRDLARKIEMYLAAYDISKDVKYLNRALEVADFAVYVFWDTEELLPRQSYFNGKYYEATWGNALLAKELLNLYYVNEEYKTGVNQYKEVWASSYAAPKSMFDPMFMNGTIEPGFFKREVSE